MLLNQSCALNFNGGLLLPSVKLSTKLPWLPLAALAEVASTASRENPSARASVSVPYGGEL